MTMDLTRTTIKRSSSDSPAPVESIADDVIAEFGSLEVPAAARAGSSKSFVQFDPL